MAVARYSQHTIREGAIPPRFSLEQRITELEREVHELRQWLAAVADDMIERTRPAARPD